MSSQESARKLNQTPHVGFVKSGQVNGCQASVSACEGLQNPSSLLELIRAFLRSRIEAQLGVEGNAKNFGVFVVADQCFVHVDIGCGFARGLSRVQGDAESFRLPRVEINRHVVVVRPLGCRT